MKTIFIKNKKKMLIKRKMVKKCDIRFDIH
jgi:hypothetical protein